MNQLYDSKFLPNLGCQIGEILDKYTIALAVKWKYDWELVKLIEQKFQLAGYSTFIIGSGQVRLGHITSAHCISGHSVTSLFNRLK